MEDKRLQFRHHESIFENRKAATDYLAAVLNESRVESLTFGGEKMAEPLVASYKVSGATAVILAIGTGDGKTYHCIDTAEINENLDAAIARIATNENDIKDIKQAIADEITRAEKAEKSLQDSINAEADARKKADDALTSAVTDEVQAREDADDALTEEMRSIEKGAGLESKTGKYVANPGTTANPIKFIAEAESLKDADEKLDKALSDLSGETIMNIVINENAKNLDGVDVSVKATVTENTAHIDLTADNVIFPTAYESKSTHHGHTVTEFAKAIDNEIEDIEETLDTKVDKEEGKSLMSEEEHKKLESILTKSIAPKDELLIIDSEGVISSKIELKYDSENQKIILSGAQGEIDSFSTTDFIKDGMLDDAEVITNGDGELVLRLTWNLAEGRKTLDVPVSRLSDIYKIAEDSKDYAAIEDYKISLKVDTTKGLASFAALQKEVNARIASDSAITEYFENQIEKIADDNDGLEERVTNNEKAIERLNGDTKVDGSVLHTIVEDVMMGQEVTDITTSDAKYASLIRIHHNADGTAFIYVSNKTADIVDENRGNQTLATTLQSLQDDIEKEADTREANDKALQDNIDAEAKARKESDDTLQDNIDNEADARKKADDVLTSAVTDEADARKKADDVLTSAVTDEADARKKADDVLTSAVTDEAQAREDADKAINNALIAQASAITALEDSLDEKADADDVYTKDEVDKAIKDNTEAIGVTTEDITIDDGPLAFLVDGVFEGNVIPSGTTYESILNMLLNDDNRKAYYLAKNLATTEEAVDTDFTAVALNTVGDTFQFTMPAGANTVIIALPYGRSIVDVYLKDTVDTYNFNTLEYITTWESKKKFLDYKKRYTFYRYTFGTAVSDANTIIVDFE